MKLFYIDHTLNKQIFMDTGKYDDDVYHRINLFRFHASLLENV